MSYVSELQHILRGKLLIIAISIAFFYIIASLYAVNMAIITDTIFGSYPMSYKTTLLQSVVVGSWNMYPPPEAILLVIIGILMGINIALMVKIFSALQANKGLRVSFGGSSVLAIASAGCPACGISLLSLIGVSVPLLPAQGVPLQLLAVTLLAGSIIYSLRKLHQPMACEVVNDGGMKPQRKSALHQAKGVRSQ